MADDVFDVEFLPDGRIKLSSESDISPANHKQAEDILKFIGEVTGDPGVRKKLRQGHVHTHGHSHESAGQS